MQTRRYVAMVIFILSVAATGFSRERQPTEPSSSPRLESPVAGGEQNSEQDARQQAPMMTPAEEQLNGIQQVAPYRILLPSAGTGYELTFARIVVPLGHRISPVYSGGYQFGFFQGVIHHFVCLGAQRLEQRSGP